MERRVFTIIAMFLGIMATPLLAQTSAQRPQVRPTDRPDDHCLRAAIVRNPEMLIAGERFVMAVGLQNGCRHIAQVHVDIYLAQEDFRVQIGTGYVELDGPRVEFMHLRRTGCRPGFSVPRWLGLLRSARRSDPSSPVHSAPVLP